MSCSPLCPNGIGPKAFDFGVARFYSSPMIDAQEKEDRLIRRVLIALPVFALFIFLATVAAVAVMVSYNFNFLSWME